ncbi:unnamed protein product [Gordionus sp. m RMFG-2023]
MFQYFDIPVKNLFKIQGFTKVKRGLITLHTIESIKSNGYYACQILADTNHLIFGNEMNLEIILTSGSPKEE